MNTFEKIQYESFPCEDCGGQDDEECDCPRIHTYVKTDIGKKRKIIKRKCGTCPSTNVVKSQKWEIKGHKGIQLFCEDCWEENDKFVEGEEITNSWKGL